MSPRVFLVTGTSTGFGRSFIEQILSNGDIAIATLRKPEVLDELTKKYSKEQLLVLPMDVTKPEQITAAFAKVKDIFGRLDVVISNAGDAPLGEVELAPSQSARDVFEINFWGHLEVVRQSLTFFREVNEPGKGGRIIFVSSVAGVVAYPMLGVYCASKHAAEAAMESLSGELDPSWNIKITSIEPGTFDTGIHAKVSPPPIPSAYSNPSLPSTFMRAAFADGAQRMNGADPEEGVRRMLKVASMEEPPLRLTLGKDAYEGLKGKLKKDLERLEKYEELSLL